MRIEPHIVIGTGVILEELCSTPRHLVIKKIIRIAALIIVQFAICRKLKYSLDSEKKKLPSGSTMFVWMVAVGRGMKYPAREHDMKTFSSVSWGYSAYRVMMTEARLKDVLSGALVGIGLGVVWNRII